MGVKLKKKIAEIPQAVSVRTILLFNKYPERLNLRNINLVVIYLELVHIN